MQYPVQRPLRRTRRQIDRFYGLEHRRDVREGAFFDAENLATDAFPLLRTRAGRSLLQRSRNGAPLPLTADSPVTAAAEIDGALCWCTETGVYLNGAAVENCVFEAAADNRRILPFGRNLFIAPDGKYVLRPDTGAPTVRHAAFRRENVYAEVCYGFGPDAETEFLYQTASPEPPASPVSGMLWLKTDGAQPTLYTYGDGEWGNAQPVYLSVRAEGIGAQTAAGERVRLSGLGVPEAEYTAVYREADRLFLAGAYVPLATDRYTVTVRRTMPVLDLAVEHNNRIWGCRYGRNMDGAFVNEIYASALGDPLRWDKFDGLSTDSYCVSLGCSGPFTGVCVLDGALLFFKENFIIRVTGGVPAEFAVSVTPARGVELGAAESVVNLNERVYYKSRTGVMAYDGALPVNVSEALREYQLTEPRAAAHNGKYYLSAAVDGGARALFVYDAETGLWQKEDDPGVCRLVPCGGNLLLLCAAPAPADGYLLLLEDAVPAGPAADPLGGTDPAVAVTAQPLPPPRWFAETGELGTGGGTRIVRGLTFRLALEPGAEFRAAVVDGGGTEIPLCRAEGKQPGAFSLPVNTPRCHAFRLRLSGKGGCTLYSAAVISEKTGEVTAYGT